MIWRALHGLVKLHGKCAWKTILSRFDLFSSPSEFNRVVTHESLGVTMTTYRPNSGESAYTPKKENEWRQT